LGFRNGGNKKRRKRKICKIVAYGCQTPSAQRCSDQNSGHLHLCQQPRAAHTLRSDQFVVQLVGARKQMLSFFFFLFLLL
jgi:hypothetical protein